MLLRVFLILPPLIVAGAFFITFFGLCVKAAFNKLRK